MEVMHKTFSGGYKFENFEGQPSKEIKVYTPVSDVADLAIESEAETTGETVLNALGLTKFDGPDSALVPTEGVIDPSLVKNIIVSTVEVEPYDLANGTILSGDNKSKFVNGLKSIHESYGKAKFTVILGEDQSELIQFMTNELSSLSWVTIATITAKYPANLKELSIPTVLDKKYPVGYAPAHLGMLFLSVSNVLAVNTVVKDKQSYKSTYVALSGPGWKENIVIDVPLGTKISEIKDKYLKDDEIRLVKNSVLNKEALNDDAIIEYDTTVIIALPEDRRRQTLFFLRAGKNADSFGNSFLSRLLPKAEKTADTNLHGERRACVSCTYCQKVCPVGLIPHILHKHVDKEIINKHLADLRIFDCVECGLCDYVCPSKIEVSSDIKKGKKMLEANDISHNKYIIPECDMILEPKEVAADE